MLQRSVAVSEASEEHRVAFFTVMGFSLASTSASETATKVQFFVAISKVDVDASKKPITVKKHREVAFCVLHHDWLLASIHVHLRNGYKCYTLCLELCHVFEVRVTLTIISGVFQQPR